METRDDEHGGGRRGDQRLASLVEILAIQQPVVGRVGCDSTGPRVDVSAVRLDASSSTSDKPKHSLGFILNEPQLPEEKHCTSDSTRSSTRSQGTRRAIEPEATTSSTRNTTTTAAAAAVVVNVETKTKGRARSARSKPRAAITSLNDAATMDMSSDEKRKARQCKEDGCGNYTINKGLCFRHGGGKKCSVEDCHASSKMNGRCWRHGGSVQCTVDGCDRRGKSRGLCWSHGGGTLCQEDVCSKVAVSNGLCWAHGGGKRCLYEGCERPAYERTLNYCPKHFEKYEKGEEVLEV